MLQPNSFQRIKVLQGELIITLAGTYDEEKLIWGAPYGVQFWFDVPVEFGLTKMTVKNISLVGEESSRRINLPDTENRKIRIRDSTPGYLSTVASVELDSEAFEYESFRLYATVVIYYKSLESFREEKIKIQLKMNSSKERRWDWFDRIMSVQQVL